MATPLWAQQSVRLCQQFSQGDFGQRVNDCIASLPATGGIGDATGFGSADIRQNTTIAITKDNVQLRLPPARIIHSGVAIAVNANHVDIGGAGNGTVLKMAGRQAANCNARLDNYSVCSITVATTRAVDNLKIHDLEIDGNAPEQGAVNGFAIQSNTANFPLSTFEFYNLYLHDHKRGGASAGGNEIQTGVSGTGKGRIHHVTCRNHSCAIVFGDDIEITDNQAFSSDDDAFGAVGGPGWMVNRITVADNQVDGTTEASCYRLVNGRNSTITGNRCKNPNFDGVTVDDNGTGPGNYTTDTTIAENKIVAPGRNGITIQGQRITVTDNTVINCSIDGIAVNDNSAYVRVERNTVNACNGQGEKYGLKVGSSPRNRVTDVWFVNNRSGDDQARPTQVYGLYVGGANSTRIYAIGNNFQGNVAGGYIFAAGTQQLADGNCVNQLCQQDDRVRDRPTFKSSRSFYPAAQMPARPSLGAVKPPAK